MTVIASCLFEQIFSLYDTDSVLELLGVLEVAVKVGFLCSQQCLDSINHYVLASNLSTLFDIVATIHWMLLAVV